MATKDELLVDVMKLPEQDRAELAHALLFSLGDASAEDPREVEAAWAAEIARRAEDVVAGRSKTVDGVEALREIQEELQVRRGRGSR